MTEIITVFLKDNPWEGHFHGIVIGVELRGKTHKTCQVSLLNATFLRDKQDFSLIS